MDRCYDLRLLRRRMGWTSSDLARRLGVPYNDIEIWEGGAVKPQDPEVVNRIEFLFRQVEILSDEVKAVPVVENALDEGQLSQIGGGSLLKDGPI